MDSQTETRAEVFWMAFQSLSRQEQAAVLRRVVVADERLRQDLMDLALIEERQTEPSRPLREYLADGHRREVYR
jgi:hypothetical protein